MPNMQKNKTPAFEQTPSERIHNWNAVTGTYTDEEAVLEASRCLNCKNHPCTEGCPVSVRIPEFIKCIAERRFDDAYGIIKLTNALPEICGCVCPQENQCEGKCVRSLKGESVAIGRLERFSAARAADSEVVSEIADAKNGVKVAVVGSGPSGLSCAGELARNGFDVTVFEALHRAGGVLVYGIPEFRLPKSIVEREIRKLTDIGVKIELNTVIGRTVTIDELFDEGYEAVFIGSGAGTPMFMDIPGINSPGVFSANEYLTRINLMKGYDAKSATPVPEAKTVAVIGGGNVAMDAARCAVRMGAKVSVVYRRGEKELPARAEEVAHAKEEGIEFLFLTNPVSINTDEKGQVCSMTCVKMELGEPDASGRRRPVEIAGSEFDIGLDTVIMALGTTPNPLIRTSTPGLDTDKKGCIVTSDGVTTTKEGVFAGGDAVTGAATVILAMGAGKQAAGKIMEFVNSKHNI